VTCGQSVQLPHGISVSKRQPPPWTPSPGSPTGGCALKSTPIPERRREGQGRGAEGAVTRAGWCATSARVGSSEPSLTPCDVSLAKRFVCVSSLPCSALAGCPALCAFVSSHFPDLEGQSEEQVVPPAPLLPFAASLCFEHHHLFSFQLRHQLQQLLVAVHWTSCGA
jgi:hypothetical protein